MIQEDLTHKLQWLPSSSGTRVLVKDGPLEGLSATFVASREHRVVLAVHVGERSIMCEMDHDCIELLDPPQTDRGSIDLRAWLITTQRCKP